MRRLIVSADDFGLSSGVNAAILTAHREGILTNASLMVNGDAFAEAVALARAAPTLGVGLHLVLVQGQATSAPRDIPALVDAQGMFRNHPVAVGFRYFFTLGIRAQLEREVRAQLEKFRSTGLPLSHVDGHLNVHMHPTVLELLLRVAPEYSIRALRVPREPLGISLALDRRWRLRKVMESATFKALARYATPRLAARGVRAPDQLFGLHQSGHVTEPYLLGVLERLPPGVTEIYCHAAHPDEHTRRWRPADYESEDELAALTSARVRETIQRSGIELIGYRTLWNELSDAASTPGAQAPG
jgi:hopanoid biosynthesis associated protein HpnK